MSIPEHNGPAGDGSAGATKAEPAHQAHDAPAPADRISEAVMAGATVGVVAVGAVLFEIALLPGIAIGVAAMLVPKFVPKAGAALTPMFRSSVRGVYRLSHKTRTMVAEAKEHVDDIVAEAHAERGAPARTT
jgi:hypothetical protein